MKPSPGELYHRFTSHKPSSEQVTKYAEIREAGLFMARGLCQLCPDNRELVAALEKLDEVVFWANAAIARGAR